MAHISLSHTSRTSHTSHAHQISVSRHLTFQALSLVLLREDHPTGAGDFLGVSAPSFKWLALIPSVWQWHRLFGFNSMLNFLGFSAQLIVIAAIAAIVISCISSPQPSSVVISATYIPCADPLVGSNDDATQSVSYCSLSMTPPVYVTAIDEPSVSADYLTTMTIRQLKALCKSRSVKGYSYLRKHELIALLSAL